MSKRILSVALLVFALSRPAIAAPNDDRDPGIAARIARVIGKVMKVLVPQDDLQIPHP